jgi:hypothetical protein
MRHSGLCGEAVVESLVKLAAVNEFRRQADEVHTGYQRPSRTLI